MLNGNLGEGEVDYGAFASEVGFQAMALVNGRTWRYDISGRYLEDTTRAVLNWDPCLRGLSGW